MRTAFVDLFYTFAVIIFAAFEIPSLSGTSRFYRSRVSSGHRVEYREARSKHGTEPR
jgi:hypothetical protein